MAKLFDRVKMSVSGTPGTGDITLGSAVSGFRTFATAGVSNSDIVSYVAEDGTAWEIGTATYSTTGPALNSRTVTSNSAGDTNPISLTSSAVVFSAAVRADLVNLREANTFASTGSIRLPNTGLKIEDTNASHVLTIAPGSDLLADRTLTVTTGNADRTIDISAGSVTITAFGGSLVDDADDTAARTTLGLGSIATQAASSVSITGGSITGITDLALADGGTGASLTDPNADRIMFWDDSAGAVTWLVPNTGLAISGTNLDISTVPIANGGTGQTSATNAFDALAPTTTAGDMIYHNGSDNVRLIAGASGTVLTGGSTPGWSADPQVTSLKIAHASDTTLTRVAAGVAAIASKAIQTSGKQTIWVPAGAMKARTTNGAATGTTEMTTNDIMVPTLDFDTATEEGAGFWITFPKSWDEGTVTFVPYWTAASGSGGVVWGLAAYAFSNDDALDTAVSGQQTSTDTFILANDLHVGPESSAITIGGTPAADDAVYFEVTREVANGSDTLGVDAKLLGVKIIFTIDSSAANDD